MYPKVNDLLVKSKKQIRTLSKKLLNKASVLLNWISLSYNRFFVLLDLCPDSGVESRLLCEFASGSGSGYGSRLLMIKNKKNKKIKLLKYDKTFFFLKPQAWHDFQNF
jgi:hypothetical protein